MTTKTVFPSEKYYFYAETFIILVRLLTQQDPTSASNRDMFQSVNRKTKNFLRS